MKRSLASVLIFFGCHMAAYSCSCVEEPALTFEQKMSGYMNNATSVYLGKVVGTDYRPGKIAPGDDHQRVKVVIFDVEKVWKGGTDDVLTLFTDSYVDPDGSTTFSSCDYSFEKGKEYLVFASERFGNLRNNPCSGTARASESAKAMEFMGEGSVPPKKDNPKVLPASSQQVHLGNYLE